MPSQVKQQDYDSPYADQISDLLKSIKSQQSAIQGIQQSADKQALDFKNMIAQQGVSFSDALKISQADSASALQALQQTMGQQNQALQEGLATQAQALADKEAADKLAAIKAAEAQKVSMANAAMGGSAPDLKIGQPAPALSSSGIKGFVRRAPLASAKISNFMGINL
jgi:hypothetical protein